MQIFSLSYAMATRSPVSTGNIDLDNKINEWLKWNKVFNIIDFYIRYSIYIYVLIVMCVYNYFCRIQMRSVKLRNSFVTMTLGLYLIYF